MPTTDVVGALTLVNAGPLTTTFTAPSSCSTSDYFWGAKGVAFDETNELAYFPLAWAGNCDFSFASQRDCLPNGDKLDKVASVSTHVPYYSPANVCPSGYQTVGIAAMSSGSASISGIFSYDPADLYVSPPSTSISFPTTPGSNWFANRLTSALGPQETAVACCPSGYTIHKYNCHSTFPVSHLAGSTGCRQLLLTTDSELFELESTKTETWEYQGATYTDTWPVPPEIPTDYEHLATSTFTFGDEGVPTLAEWYEQFPGGLGLDRDDVAFVGVSIRNVMYLINDSGSDTEESSSVVESSSAGESDAAEESEEPSAGSALAPASLWRAVGGVMAVWTIGAIAGVGIMAAL